MTLVISYQESIVYREVSEKISRASVTGESIEFEEEPWVRTRVAMGVIGTSQPWHLTWAVSKGWLKRKELDGKTFVYCPEDLKFFVDNKIELPKKHVAKNKKHSKK